MFKAMARQPVAVCVLLAAAVLAATSRRAAAAGCDACKLGFYDAALSSASATCTETTGRDCTPCDGCKQEALDLVLVVDMSASVGREDHGGSESNWQTLKNFAAEIVTRLGGTANNDTQVAVVTFSTK